MRLKTFTLFSLVSAAAFTVAAGFDADAWLLKREVVSREAERLASVFARQQAAADSPAEGLVVPIESWPDGTVKTDLRADRAQFFPSEGLVWGAGVKIKQRRADQSAEAEVTATELLFERATRCVWAEGATKAVYGGDTVIEGEGVYLDFEEGYLRISSNTVVVANGDELRGRRADYDRDAGVVMLEGEVRLKHVDRGEVYNLGCDRAFVFLEGTNSLKRVVALGSVTLAGGTRNGSCDKAVYLKNGGRITMYGRENPCEPARLKDAGGKAGELQGSKITFWTESEQVEVLDSKLSVEAGALNGGKGMKW